MSAGSWLSVRASVQLLQLLPGCCSGHLQGFNLKANACVEISDIICRTGVAQADK